MERAVAVKKLTRILGGSLAYRVDPKAPKADDRAAARAQLADAVAKRNSLQERVAARREAILKADAEYQNLLKAHEIACKHAANLSSMMRHYKFTVGTNNGMFFVVKAEGDTWEEVIGKLTTTDR
jgi:hypothetical protein